MSEQKRPNWATRTIWRAFKIWEYSTGKSWPPDPGRKAQLKAYKIDQTRIVDSRDADRAIAEFHRKMAARNHQKNLQRQEEAERKRAEQSAQPRDAAALEKEIGRRRRELEALQRQQEQARTRGERGRER